VADPDRFLPLNGWVLVRRVRPKHESRSGLVFVVDEDQSTSESVGVVVRLPERPQYLKDGSTVNPADELSVGDLVVHRGFIRHANAMGELFGGSRHDDFYLILPSDILGVAERGSGLRIGEHGEYEA
jgi:co-chaperonin GroES (HSP10)